MISIPDQSGLELTITTETVLLLGEDKERGKVCLLVAREKGRSKWGGESRDSVVW